MICTKFDGYGRDGSRRLFMGGGGGGGNAKYAGLEDLYNEQAASARLLREQANENLPAAVQSYVGKTNEILDPGYAEQQAGMAAADLEGANAKEAAATQRNLVSLGVNPNDPRFAGSLKSAELTNSARLAAGKNLARTNAKNYQLNVAKDAVGTFTGQNNTAANQMGNAASGLASLYSTENSQNLANQQMQSQNTANMVGAGIGLMMPMKKDGGRICAPRGIQRLKSVGRARKLERFSFGGVTGGSQRGFLSTASAQPVTMTTPTPQSSSPLLQGIQTGRMLGRGISNMTGRVQGMQAGAGMNAEQATAASDAYKAAAQAATDPAQKKAYEQAATDIGRGNKWFGSSESAPVSEATQAAGAAETAATGGNAAQAAGAAGLTSAETAAGAAAANAAATGAAEGAAGALAGDAAGATAAGALGGAGAAIGTALPWVGAALAAGKLLGMYADGGDVKAKDFRVSGGEVSGPGSHTDDLVPALLSDDEHVMNAEAAALMGHDKLEAINKQGLALRKKGYTPGQIRASGFGIKKEAA